MNSKRLIVDATVRCLSTAGIIPSVVRRFQSEECCILMLHGVTSNREHPGIENAESINIPEDDLDSICSLLAESYHVTPLERIVECLEQNEPLPKNSVVLTFDDGYASNYHLAWPILKKHGLHGTVFIATDFVENGAFQWWDRLEYALGHSEKTNAMVEINGRIHRVSIRNEAERRSAYFRLLRIIKALPQEIVGKELSAVEEALGCSLAEAEEVPEIYQPLNWDQVREMQASGVMSFGAHTHTHRILGRCQPETAREELTTCARILKERIGLERPLFSYPNGHEGDHTAETRELVRELGFRCALLTETGFNQQGDDLFRLKRFSTGNDSRYVDVTASGAMKVLLAINDAIRGRKAA